MKQQQQQKIHIRLPASLKREVDQAAVQDMRSINSWVVIAIKEKLARAKA